MALSRKEIIAVLLLITALLSVMNASLFANIMPLHSSYEQLGQMAVSVGTAYICLIYALSTWLYHSNYYRARQEMRFVLATMLLVMMVCNSVSLRYFDRRLSFEKLEKCTELRNLFSSFTMASRRVCMALSLICILLMFVALVIIIYKIWTSRKKQIRAKFKESA